MAFSLLFTAFSSAVYSQDFSRTIELKNPRMNGQDVLRLQTRLLALGFSGIGEADGYYGPLSEGAIKSIQTFSNFEYEEANGKVERALWDYIFDNRNSAFLRDVGAVSSYYTNTGPLVKTRNFYDHIKPIEHDGDDDPGETPSGWVYFSPTDRRNPKILELGLDNYIFFYFYFIDNARYLVKNDIYEETLEIFWINNNRRFRIENGVAHDANYPINRIIESAFGYKDEILKKFFDEYR
jgi:hypothetical protein